MSHTVIQGPFFGKSEVCESILRALPQWFGIEEALVQYIKDIEALPTLLASVDSENAGFLTIKQHNDYAAELYVMGIHSEFHRQGIGRALVNQAEEVLRQRGIEYWQVKTLAPSYPELYYARTRMFYLAMGFRPLEEFKEIWGKASPCLLMVKRL